MEEEHLHQLQAVFEWFLEHGLKLKSSKCHFLREEITFLGHQILVDRIKPGNEGLKDIAKMAPLSCYTEVWRFLGATGFFRHFFKNYAHIAKPLNDLLEGKASKLKAQPVTLPTEALEAFNILKMHDYPSTGLCWLRETIPPDSLSLGLGVVLSQKQPDGKLDLEKRQRWPEYLGSVVIAYKATQSLVTGYSPYYLMFSQRPPVTYWLIIPDTMSTIDDLYHQRVCWCTGCLPQRGPQAKTPVWP